MTHFEKIEYINVKTNKLSKIILSYSFEGKSDSFLAFSASISLR